MNPGCPCLSLLGRLTVFLALTTILAAKPVNVVLIMADDMGYECVKSNGSTSYQTPHLDRLAREGCRFEHCYSQPLCTPSRVQIMTGKYNFRNYEEFGYLNPKEKTFGHLLKDAGYATCIVGKWQLNGLAYDLPGFDDGTRPLKAGFDESCLWQVTQGRSKGERYANPLIETNGKIVDRDKEAYGPDVFCNYACDFIERNKERPFFVYYPMVLPHEPFVATPDSPEWKGGRRNKKEPRFFADMIAYTDKMAGRIASRLEILGLAENTLFIFTADNGVLNTALVFLRTP
ncbi:MAG: sulfatase-like hydrolase/transferase [Verrucomicrobiota bacterium]